MSAAQVVTLVLLPGMDGTGELFAGFVAALGDELVTQVISYPPELKLDYEALEQFVRQRLPRDGAFILLGESFSGPVAIAIAAAPPPGLIGLILCCTFARTPVPLLRFLRPLVSILPISGRLTSLLAPFLLGQHASRELRNNLQRALALVPVSTLRMRLRAVLDVDYCARLGQVRLPVLYLQARRDLVVPSSAARLVASLCPHAELASFDAPHLLLQTSPSDSAKVVKVFCNAR